MCAFVGAVVCVFVCSRLMLCGCDGCLFVCWFGVCCCCCCVYLVCLFVFVCVFVVLDVCRLTVAVCCLCWFVCSP